MIFVSKTAKYVHLYFAEKMFLLLTFNAFIIYDSFLVSVEDTMRLLTFSVHNVKQFTIALFQRRQKPAKVDFTKAFKIVTR